MSMKAVDLFAGWGGFTEGATIAGAEVVWAANHWPLAVEAHEKNHPETIHVCQDLRQADWTRIPTYDLLLASPACQGHSTASQPGRRAYHDEMRATAWAVVDAAEATAPRAIVVENVPTFSAWRLFPSWRDALQRLGYKLEIEVANCSAHGVPQRRRRLFVVATRDDVSVHRRLKQIETPEVPFGPCIDWEDPAPWRSVSQARDGVRLRIERSRPHLGGVTRFLTQHTTDHFGTPLEEPIRTITTKDHWAVVDGDRYRPLTVRETARAMGFRDSYAWPDHATRGDCMTGLGNAVPPPMATAIVRSVIDCLT